MLANQNITLILVILMNILSFIGFPMNALATVYNGDNGGFDICPEQEETINGFEDYDGCPDVARFPPGVHSDITIDSLWDTDFMTHAPQSESFSKRMPISDRDEVVTEYFGVQKGKAMVFTVYKDEATLLSFRSLLDPDTRRNAVRKITIWTNAGTRMGQIIVPPVRDEFATAASNRFSEASIKTIRADPNADSDDAVRLVISCETLRFDSVGASVPIWDDCPTDSTFVAVGQTSSSAREKRKAAKAAAAAEANARVGSDDTVSFTVPLAPQTNDDLRRVQLSYAEGNTNYVVIPPTKTATWVIEAPAGKKVAWELDIRKMTATKHADHTESNAPVAVITTDLASIAAEAIPGGSANHGEKEVKLSKKSERGLTVHAKDAHHGATPPLASPEGGEVQGDTMTITVSDKYADQLDYPLLARVRITGLHATEADATTATDAFSGAMLGIPEYSHLERDNADQPPAASATADFEEMMKDLQRGSFACEYIAGYTINNVTQDIGLRLRCGRGTHGFFLNTGVDGRINMKLRRRPLWRKQALGYAALTVGGEYFWGSGLYLGSEFSVDQVLTGNVGWRWVVTPGVTGYLTGKTWMRFQVLTGYERTRVERDHIFFEDGVPVARGGMGVQVGWGIIGMGLQLKL